MVDMHKQIRRKFGIRRTADDFMPLVSSRRKGRIQLAELLGEQGFNKGAEIGVQRGRFSQILCDNNPNIELYCIDFWKPYRGTRITQEKQNDLFKLSVEKLTPYNVKILRKSSIDGLGYVKDKSLDFVYIDANHAFNHVCPDIIFWSEKVRGGGIIACHDYMPMAYGVIKAVDAYTHCNGITPWYVTNEMSPTAFWVNP